MKNNLSILGVIPARYGSSRFPGKPLALITGKSLIQRTYENAKRCPSLEHVVVATDDQRIFDHVQAFGGEVVMTSASCPTGTDRIVEVIRNYNNCSQDSIVVNIQGDHPCLDPQDITSVIKVLQDNPEEVMSTIICPLENEEDAANPSVVKCVINKTGHALYFSRALIPFSTRQTLDFCYHHLGIYGYRCDFLLHSAELSPTPLQQAEDLEQLKILEHGYTIRTAIVQRASPGVDNPQDIQKVEQWLCKHAISSSPVESSPL